MSEDIKYANVGSSNDTLEFPIISATFQGRVKTTNAMTLYPTGYFARPVDGDLTVFANILSNEEVKIALPTTATSRKKNLKQGETGIENVLRSSFVYMRDDGTIEINAPEKDVIINAANNVTVTSTNVTVTASNDITLTATNNFRIAAKNLTLHATTRFKFDANGHGQSYTTSNLDSHVIGATGASFPLSPPETP